jgi:polyisoprenyl-phosphate glycosyltransferase
MATVFSGIPLGAYDIAAADDFRMTELSVVVPVYGCNDCLRRLHRRVVATLDRLGRDFELVYVEDGGNDGSWESLVELAAEDRRVRAFRLSRNFGQHAAITAGLAQSSGRWVVVMDCDLEDPPEEIPRLYAKAAEGYDVVLARRDRKGTGWIRHAMSRLYFRLLNLMTGASLDGTYGSFSIISRKVVEAFLELRERDRHYLLVLHWLGFERAAIDYEQSERAAGRSSYGPRALLRHALSGLFFQTTVLLRWVVYFGFALSAAGLIAAIYFAIARIVGTGYPGWTSLFVLIVIVGGFIIVSTGVTGLYIGRVFDEVRRRPLFVIDKAVNGETDGSEPHRDAVSAAAMGERNTAG